MIDAAPGQRRSDVHEPGAVALLTATWAEALPLLGLHPRVSGMGRRAWVLDGCVAVISAGFAGACRAELGPGDVLLAGDVPAGLRERLGAREGQIRTLEHIAGPEEKAALGLKGVAAVDLETAWLAAAAAEAAVPFLGVRVVIDRVQDQAVGVRSAAHYARACLALRRAVAGVIGAGPHLASPAAVGDER